MPRFTLGGMIEKTGIRPRLAAATTDSSATSTVTSPPTHRACAPRATRELAASKTPDELSMLDSSRFIPNSWQALRAAFVKASEFDSAGFHATPTDCRPGKSRLARANALSTGIKLPMPTRCLG